MMWLPMALNWSPWLNCWSKLVTRTALRMNTQSFHSSITTSDRTMLCFLISFSSDSASVNSGRNIRYPIVSHSTVLLSTFFAPVFIASDHLLCINPISIFITLKSITINPQLKPWGLINFKFHNYPGSNQKRSESKT